MREKSNQKFGSSVKLLLVFMLLTLLFSCNQKVKLDGDKTWGVKPGQGKFSLQLVQKDWNKTIDFIANGDASALFYVTDKGEQYLMDKQSVKENTENVYSAVYKTTDNRKAVVIINKNKDGFMVIDMKIIPSEGVTQVGATY